MKEFKYTITDPEGIHARPAGELIIHRKSFSVFFDSGQRQFPCHSRGGNRECCRVLCRHVKRKLPYSRPLPIKTDGEFFRLAGQISHRGVDADGESGGKVDGGAEFFQPRIIGEEILYFVRVRRLAKPIRRAARFHGIAKPKTIR